MPAPGRVLIPKENEKDLKEIPAQIKRAVKIIMVDHMDEVLGTALALEDAQAFLREGDPPSRTSSKFRPAALPGTIFRPRLVSTDPNGRAKGQWVGRWYFGILRGQSVHSNIAVAPEQAGEKSAALVGYYAIGIALAVLYVFGTGWLGVSPGVFLVALGYGFATCVFPWFLLFPALGFGFFGLRGPPELRLFTSSLMNHMFYGFGLWWIAKVLRLG